MRHSKKNRKSRGLLLFYVECAHFSIENGEKVIKRWEDILTWHVGDALEGFHSRCQKPEILIWCMGLQGCKLVSVNYFPFNDDFLKYIANSFQKPKCKALSFYKHKHWKELALNSAMIACIYLILQNTMRR